MELGMRDWFLVIGGLMIAGVLAHGAWLWLKSRRSGLGVRYERDIPDIDVDDIDLLRGELPSGGARVLTSEVARVDRSERQTELDVEAASAPGPEADAPARRGVAGGRRLDLDEQVPVLMDPIDQDVARETAEDQRREAPAAERGPVIGEDRGSASEDDPGRAAPAAATEPGPGSFGDTPSVPGRAPRPGADPEAGARGDAAPEAGQGGFEQAPLFAGEPIVARNERTGPGERKRARGARSEAAPEPVAAEPLGPPEDVIVINVLCRRGEVADGPTLVETITDQGMRFGDMNIFHRTSPGDRGRIDFSLASAVEPGTFDLGAMDDFTTPGVTLFMQLPGPAKPIEAFEDMVRIARGIASRIGADLKDEQHSVMTAQTIEHCRQRVREFTRRQMSRRA